MKYTLLGVLLSSVIAIPAIAGDAQPSTDWNANWGFMSPSDKAVLFSQADLIEWQKNGGYNTTNNIDQSTIIGDTNIQCDSGDNKFSGGCTTKIDQQNNSTAIGSQVVNDQSNTNNTSIHVDGKGNSVEVTNDQNNATDNNNANTNGDTTASSEVTNITNQYSQ